MGNLYTHWSTGNLVGSTMPDVSTGVAIIPECINLNHQYVPKWIYLSVQPAPHMPSNLSSVSNSRMYPELAWDTYGLMEFS